MPDSAPSATRIRSMAREFATTRWTVIAQAGSLKDSEAREALEKLCLAYWYPLYAFLRRQGYAPADAEDAVQGFLASILERNDLARTDPLKGQFRSFLLAALKHYLSNQRAHDQAQKRGGGMTHFSLDAHSAETRYQHEPAHTLSPDRLFDRRWALSLIERAMENLRQDYREAGKASSFEILKNMLTGEKGALPYSVLAAQLKVSEPNAKVLAHRLRRRYRDLLRAEIGQTVLDPADIDQELQHLLAALTP